MKGDEKIAEATSKVLRFIDEQKWDEDGYEIAEVYAVVALEKSPENFNNEHEFDVRMVCLGTNQRPWIKEGCLRLALDSAVYEENGDD